MNMQMRKFRKAKRLTQQQVADVAGMSRSYYAEIENGTKDANGRRIQRIADALGVHPADLFLDNGEDPDIRQFIRMFLSFDEEQQERAFRYLVSLRDEPDDPGTA